LTTQRWRLLFLAAATFAFVMATLPHPPRIPGSPDDKVQHIIAFATLAALGRMAFPTARALQILGALSLYGALIEFIQLYPPLNRDGDIVDWLADTSAVAVVLLLLRLVRR
jgi:VanZ family protein